MTDSNKDNILDIYEEIKDRIVRGQLSPDIKINQNKIAMELGVSRTPVVKALHMLKSEGLVDNIPNKGFYVHKISLQDTVELYELRQAIEMVAAACTAEYAAIEDISQLKDIFTPFTAQAPINVEQYAEADRIFHSRLIELSRNNLLQKTNQSILILPKSFTSGLLRDPYETLNEHFDIIEALMNRNCRQAQDKVREHMEHTLMALRSAMTGLRKIGVDPGMIPVTDIAANLTAGIKED